MNEIQVKTVGEGEAPKQQQQPGILVGNLGEAIKLTGVNLCGVSATSARASEKVEVWTRLALTSDDRAFHRIVESRYQNRIDRN